MHKNTAFACAASPAAIEYVLSRVMLNVSSMSVRQAVRTGIAILAVALILVPTIKRAQQHVEHRDATRLSIRHNWIGVAPPTKAAIAPQQVLVPPMLGPELARPRFAMPPAGWVEPVRHSAVDLSPDPLRGPPSNPL